VVAGGEEEVRRAEFGVRSGAQGGVEGGSLGGDGAAAISAGRGVGWEESF
jgi:hypothetical protein